MKLATLRDGGRDGTLVVVSSNLTRAAAASAIAPTLQAAVDDWAAVAPKLRELAGALENGRASGAFDLDMARLAAPLPRAYGFIDSSVYLNHMELARALRGTTLQETYRQQPLISLRPPAPFLGGHDDLPLPPGEDPGLDIEAEVAVITTDVPAGTSVERAEAHIALVTLVNDTSLRTVLAKELGLGRSAYLGKAPGAMAPVAVTLDELGPAWTRGTVALPLLVDINGTRIGTLDPGVDLSFTFADIIAYACQTRPLMSGTVVASGTLSNRNPKAGTACIAERRMLETKQYGKPQTAYLKSGDTLRIEMKDAAGRSVFGAINQTVR